MNSEPLDQREEPTTDEFEKLEFLPEEPEAPENAHDETAEIIFAPEEDADAEPPISFDQPDEQPSELTFDPLPPSELDAPVSFELLGTSLFEDGDFDDDLATMDPIDFDDDLEF